MATGRLIGFPEGLAITTWKSPSSHRHMYRAAARRPWWSRGSLSEGKGAGNGGDNVVQEPCAH